MEMSDKHTSKTIPNLLPHTARMPWDNPAQLDVAQLDAELGMDSAQGWGAWHSCVWLWHSWIWLWHSWMLSSAHLDDGGG